MQVIPEVVAYGGSPQQNQEIRNPFGFQCLIVDRNVDQKGAIDKHINETDNLMLVFALG